MNKIIITLSVAASLGLAGVAVATGSHGNHEGNYYEKKGDCVYARQGNDNVYKKCKPNPSASPSPSVSPSASPQPSVSPTPSVSPVPARAVRPAATPATLPAVGAHGRR
jgi:hypothetical protein